MKAIDMMMAYRFESLAKTTWDERFLGKVYFLGHLTGTKLWRRFGCYSTRSFGPLIHLKESDPTRIKIMKYELTAMKRQIENVLKRVDETHWIEEPLTVTVSCETMGHKKPKGSEDSWPQDCKYGHEIQIGWNRYNVDDFQAIKNLEGLKRKSKGKVIVT